ncbi:hypothetical protein WS105_1241 [Weissella ceti]|uniref:Uncharacterized protein n=2 Tax=Weissella TaxID=46255 RepID=A0A075U0S3_9LACO|nr:hypothetical protein WS08_1178 [Weissella tructae]AIM63496.1 hypothetical protein WS74_1247 [Weissella ceti]AIM64831.1 hypothetical protein WS105_1241 [Weissella ceti]ELA07489.1 hypothetical protein WCNC_03497 [Weissella ceti NC36]
MTINIFILIFLAGLVFLSAKTDNSFNRLCRPFQTKLLILIGIGGFMLDLFQGTPFCAVIALIIVLIDVVYSIHQKRSISK